MNSMVDYATASATDFHAPSTTYQGALFDMVWSFLLETRYELFVFTAAIIAHSALFGSSFSFKKQTKRQSLKAKSMAKEAGLSVDGPQRGGGLPTAEELSRTFSIASDTGDHRQVLRCWNAAKRYPRMPELPLAPVVEGMQRLKKDSVFIISELKDYLRRSPYQGDVAPVNDLLESLGSRLDSGLMQRIVDVLPSVGLRPDQRTYEILLNINFMLRDFAEVQRLTSISEAQGTPLTTRGAIVVIKTALKTSRLDMAFHHFRQLKDLWGHSEAASGPSPAPRHIVGQLVELACKEGKLVEFLPELRDMPMTEEAIGLMLSECVRKQDANLSRKVEKFARTHGPQSISDASYVLLIKAFAGDATKVHELFNEVSAAREALSQDIVLAFLAACARTGSTSLAVRMCDQLQPDSPQLLGSFLRFFTEVEEHEKACDLYENALSRRCSGAPGSPKRCLPLDARTEKALMNAAIRCGRIEMTKAFLDAAPCDISRHISMIRNCAAEGNLRGAHDVFESLYRCSVDLNSVVYNTVLDACVECRDLKRAEAWMVRTKEAGMADVVSYNTLIKAYLQSENFVKARQLMEEMRQAGLQPNRVTFNELVNAMVVKKASARSSEVWEVLEEMKAAGMSPNQVTCSILLKSLNARSSDVDVNRTMELINAMEEPMDEVLLSSVVEACVRIGRPELLASKLRQLQDGCATAISGSHTFGSLIKAYGHAKDIHGVWRCWREMRSRHVRPTSITAGCMVEAVVSNGDTEGAYELIHQMRQDEQCRGTLNSVVYCSVLKGFTRERRLDRVWTVFKEMQSNNVDLSVVTFNTVIDACARCGSMDQVPKLFSEMKEAGVRPNIITYSTMVKGYCGKGQVHKAFSIIEEMRRETDLKPDEIMYNSLLDGCAQSNLVEDGLTLLEQMQSEGVPPSNFTLSLLVKLMSRSRKLDTAFELVEQLCAKYRFRPNVHVLTNLIQACVSNKQLKRGIETWEQMVRDRVQPDNRTYAVLLRASLSHGWLKSAEELLRGALGLQGAPASAACGNLDCAVVNEALVGLGEKGASEVAIPLLAEIKRCRPRVRIDAATQRRLMRAGSASSPLSAAQSPSTAGRRFTS